MSYNMMIGYDIYECFAMDHFRLRQRRPKFIASDCKFKNVKVFLIKFCDE
jgi:hypothetical protein